MYKFNDYLRACREALNLTQNELVSNLIGLSKDFSSLDTTTLSRWERGVSKPTVAKQTLIIDYFSKQLNGALPLVGSVKECEIQASLCPDEFSKLFGQNTHQVMKFPTHHIESSEFKVVKFVESELKSEALSKHQHVFEGLCNIPLDLEQIQAFSLNSSNLFLICEYQEQYFGHLFVLRLKPDALDDLLNFRRTVHSLNGDDIAGIDEVASLYFFGAFAMSDEVISKLFIHFYTYLIKGQELIQDLGSIVLTKDGHQWALNMNMQLEATMAFGDYSGYKGSINRVLNNQMLVKMLFNAENGAKT
ncbi:MAG TPA: XRE family transcriptional regulator [Thiomicrospira sp.]|nr:XRE family transcriptional regulator [Thiomicrospira sp.]